MDEAGLLVVAGVLVDHGIVSEMDFGLCNVRFFADLESWTRVEG